jgi:hypothetical protein
MTPHWRALPLVGLAGCAFPPLPSTITSGTIYQGTVDPVQYRSPLPRDVHASPAGPRDRQATGQSCRTLLSFPAIPPTPFYGSGFAAQIIPWQSLALVFGDDSYAAAVGKARDSVDGAILYDVRADIHTTALLGVWRRECIEIHAAVARGAAPPR